MAAKKTVKQDEAVPQEIEKSAKSSSVKKAAKAETVKKTAKTTKTAKASAGTTTKKKAPAKKSATKTTRSQKFSQYDGKTLVVVESPAKAKTLEKILGTRYKVLASVGHVRDLPKGRLAIDVEHDFEPEYIQVRGKADLIKTLKGASAASERTLLASDPDREGEAIAWHLASLLDIDTQQQCRIRMHEITEHGVRSAISEPDMINMELVEAQQARRVLDRLVGYELSPLLWYKVQRGLSAGRVQSVALRIVCEREEEIERFIPEEYWLMDVDANSLDKKRSYKLRVEKYKNKPLTINNEEEALKIEGEIRAGRLTVDDFSTKESKKQPSPPFKTSTLQQEASRRCGFAPKRTMRIAQALYEGIEIPGRGPTGLITYMRTDSLRIADEAAAAAKQFIAGRWGDNYVCPTQRKWKSRSATAAQDAHEAIRPSMPELTPDEVEQSISGDTAKLYRLIWSRFMASQMADCVQDTVSVTITAGDYLFRASGFRVSFDGFTALYEESTDDKQKKETALPELEQGQELQLKSLTADQKFTQPPPLYTEATLIHALEENGIGRPSTYAPIITTIVDRGYVEKDQKKLKTTPLGQAVNQVMMEQFPEIVDVKFSADMEKKLDVVEAGEADWVQTVDEFYQGFAKSLENAEKNMEGKRVKVEDIPTDEICEKCGRPMVIKSGRYGKFVACSGFPECRNAHPLVKDTGGICPLCGGHMLVRKSAKGRIYYGCSNYPQCNFMTWDEPVPEKCPQCGNTLFKKKGQLYCAKEGCDFVKPMEKK